MSKHSVGDRVGHSTRGNGTITAVGKATKTIELDVAAATDEMLKIRARLEWLERTIPIANQPIEFDVYSVTFDAEGSERGGFDDEAIDKLKTRIR